MLVVLFLSCLLQLRVEFGFGQLKMLLHEIVCLWMLLLSLLARLRLLLIHEERVNVRYLIRQ